MSFLWIALCASLVVSSLSSITPILTNIDANNQEGPHFRSFLFPNILISSNPTLPRSSASIKQFPEAHAVPTFSSRPTLPSSFISTPTDLLGGSPSPHGLTLSSSSSVSASPVSTLGNLLPESQPVITSAADPEALKNDVILARNSAQNLLSSLNQNSEQEDIQTNVLENLKFPGNSLESFKFELHPEEELEKRG